MSDYITEDGVEIKFGKDKVWWVTDINDAKWDENGQLKGNKHTGVWRIRFPELLDSSYGVMVKYHIDPNGKLMDDYYKVFYHRENADRFILNQHNIKKLLNYKNKIMKPTINIEAYFEAKEKGNTDIIETTVGTIESAEFLPKNKKMIKMMVRFSDSDLRSVISNIGGRLPDISVLKGKQMPFVTNLEPAIVSKHESQAMIVVEEENGELIIPQ